MRNFTISELYGPLQCEFQTPTPTGFEYCGNPDSWTIRLTDEENSSLPEQSGPFAVNFIFRNKLGIVLCKEHLKTNVESRKRPK